MAYSHYYADTGVLHGSCLHLMGTGLDALVIEVDKQKAERVWMEIVLETERLHRMFNRFSDSSELTRINNTAALHDYQLSPEWWAVMSDLRHYHDLTKGYFDPTCGYFDRILFDDARRSVRFKNSSVSIDLGGYAKGYALQRMKDILNDHQVTQSLINFGNSAILAVGNHPHGSAWPVGLTHPYLPYKTLKSFLLRDLTLSSSGNTSSNVGHIINPMTREKVETGKIVSVVSTHCIDAEVLSTALMAADEDMIPVISQEFPECQIDIFNLHI